MSPGRQQARVCSTIPSIYAYQLYAPLPPLGQRWGNSLHFTTKMPPGAGHLDTPTNYGNLSLPYVFSLDIAVQSPEWKRSTIHEDHDGLPHAPRTRVVYRPYTYTRTALAPASTSPSMTSQRTRLANKANTILSYFELQKVMLKVSD